MMADALHTFLPSPYRHLEVSEIALLADRLDPVDGKGAFSPKTVGEVFVLDFYPGLDLIRLTDPDWLPQGVCIYLIQGRDDELYRLKGTSPPIHEVNAKVPLKLTEALAPGYLRFFCFFVHGEEGPFHICADTADPLLPSADTGVAEHVEPPRVYGADPNGKFRLSASVFYSNAVFNADFLVAPTGMIEMLDDRPVIVGLPAQIAAPLIVTNSSKPDQSKLRKRRS